MDRPGPIRAAEPDRKAAAQRARRNPSSCARSTPREARSSRTKTRRARSRQQARIVLNVVVFVPAREALVQQHGDHGGASERRPDHLHILQQKLDRSIGGLCEVAGKVLAVDHLEVGPHADSSADFRDQLAVHVVDLDLRRWRLAFPHFGIVDLNRTGDEQNRLTGVVCRAVLNAELHVVANASHDARGLGERRMLHLEGDIGFHVRRTRCDRLRPGLVSSTHPIKLRTRAASWAPAI